MCIHSMMPLGIFHEMSSYCSCIKLYRVFFCPKCLKIKKKLVERQYFSTLFEANEHSKHLSENSIPEMDSVYFLINTYMEGGTE